MRRPALLILLVAAGLTLGFGAALLLIRVVGLIVPFRPEDDDALREFVPVGLAYLAWAGTALAVVVLGWRRFGAQVARPPEEPRSGDDLAR